MVGWIGSWVVIFFSRRCSWFSSTLTSKWCWFQISPHNLSLGIRSYHQFKFHILLSLDWKRWGQAFLFCRGTWVALPGKGLRNIWRHGMAVCKSHLIPSHRPKPSHLLSSRWFGESFVISAGQFTIHPQESVDFHMNMSQIIRFLCTPLRIWHKLFELIAVLSALK